MENSTLEDFKAYIRKNPVPFGYEVLRGFIEAEGKKKIHATAFCKYYAANVNTERLNDEKDISESVNSRYTDFLTQLNNETNGK